ncbi:8781_t:CDS:2, partial [Scutellospora calospora]
SSSKPVQTPQTRSQFRFNPITPLKLLKYPNVTLVVIYITVIYTIIHIQNISVPRNFSTKYKLSEASIGLLFLAPCAGFIFGSFIGGKYSDFLLKKTLNSDGTLPEIRILSVWFGTLLIPITCFIYGWLLEDNFRYEVLLVVWFFCAFGILSSFNSLATYLVDACPGRGASVTALNNSIRYIIAGILTIFETTIEDNFGIRWSFVFISGLSFI